MPPDQIVVSDNSTDDAARGEVQRICAEFGARYIRPDTPCSMSDHWDWLLSQLASGEWGSHFTFLTDRMVFRHGALRELLELSRRHPDDAVAYPIDAVRDDEHPVRLHLHPWTGRVVRIPSIHTLRALARAEMPLSAPLLLNTLVPVPTLVRIRSVYPRVCDTIAPDYSFCLKFLDVVDHYVFFDKPLLLQHALTRSNGRSFTTGRPSSERIDFLNNLPPGQVFNACAPIPEIPVAVNTAVHEYESMRRRGPRRSFPPLDLPRYYARLRDQVGQLEDLDARRHFLALIPDTTSAHPSAERRTPVAARIRRATRRLLWPVFGAAFNRTWRYCAQSGWTPPGMRWLTFENSDSAREIAQRHMIRPSRTSCFLADLNGSDVENPHRD